LKLFQDSLDGGAWPFLVRDVSRLLYCDNERDRRLLIQTGRAHLFDYTTLPLTPYGLSRGGVPPPGGARPRDLWGEEHGSELLWEFLACNLLRGTALVNSEEAVGKNRSVMPFEVLGGTRATLEV